MNGMGFGGMKVHTSPFIISQFERFKVLFLAGIPAILTGTSDTIFLGLSAGSLNNNTLLERKVAAPV
jgi:hypothetical protein